MTVSSPLARGAAFAALLAALLAPTPPAAAQEAVLRKALMERIPHLPPIDEISKSPVPGLYEVRIGTTIYYADEKGDYLIEGSIIDTRNRSNLTEARIDKLTAVAFADLPFKDAMVIKQGSGARKMAIFVDPNCGYCKRFERDLATVKDLTIYAFLYPILGADSTAKARDIWCAKEPSKTWRAWMLNGEVPPKMMGAKCDDKALSRNVAFGAKYRVQGTPALFFEDGTRKPGAISADEVELLLTPGAPAKGGKG
jgi:thiol:disulfide interchange protein DsbC